MVNTLEEFKKQRAVILANRYDMLCDDAKDKAYTEKLYMRD